MSRTVYQNGDKFIEEISSMDECKNMINDVCCDFRSPYGGMLVKMSCDSCPCYTGEDGKINDGV